MTYGLYKGSRLPDNSIRILTLLPGTEEEEIRCQMRCATLSDRPRYSAVSYMWGPSDERRTIWINEQQIYVRKNLWSALQRLRLRTQDRKLWVDAICIYSHRTRIKCCRNLRFEPLFCEGFDFTAQRKFQGK
jgi:Heterokaryon incompatibility protein (HET)